MDELTFILWIAAALLAYALAIAGIGALLT